MHTVKGVTTNTIDINKSIFITSVFSVSSVNEVTKYLNETRKKYYDAKHNCYAYIIGDEQNIQKANDDGEPSKTAGFPMLNVLKKRELTNILVITTRYFGGIKLGAGGLIRAYGSSVSLALEKANTYHFEIETKLIINFDYSTYNSFINSNHPLTISNTSFSDLVTVTASISKNLLDEFIKDLDNILLGNKTYQILEDYKTLVLDKKK